MIHNFSWVVPNLLAGSSLPGEDGALAEDLRELARRGVRCLVSLTESASAFGPAVYQAGLLWEYFPIPNFDVPTDAQAFHSLVERLLDHMKHGRPVCIHCYAGVGRTGLLLCCLAGRYYGLAASRAIGRVRAVRPALETDEQELFVRRYLGA